MPVPQWAQGLIIQVAIDEGRETLPHVIWWRRRGGSPWTRKFSSGRGGPPVAGNMTGSIHITAGSDRKDQKLVLLHELAHWLMPPQEHHGARFWDKAWQLYRRYGVPIRYAKAREAQYRKGSVTAYRRAARGRGKES
jgi:hypothetical protein